MKRFIPLLLSLAAALPAWAQFQPQAGKFYTIAMKTNAAQYMVENADGTVGVTAYDKTQRIFWEFIPTETSNCYYMRNATTKRYVMSCNGTQKDPISTQSTPVEYFVAVSSGYVRFTSTDCANYNNTAKTPNGLNKDGASSNVIVWAAGASNNNSWWKLAETDYLFESRPVLAHSDFMKSAQIYDNPCATASDIYITSLRTVGVEDDGVLVYPATGSKAGKPTEAFQIYTQSKAKMRRGKDFGGTLTLSKVPQEGDSLYIYFDFDRDGEFEECLRPELASTVSFSVPVAEDVPLGQSRMRVRLTNNGFSGADQEVCGQTIDFVVRAVDATDTRIEVTETASAIKLYADGRMLTAQSAKGIALMELFTTQGARLAAVKAATMSLENLPAGVYIVKLLTRKDASVQTAKIFIP